MSITSVEQITSQGSGDLNEDTFVADKVRGLFGVFDGASSLVNYRSDKGETGALIAAKIAADTFANMSGELVDVAAQANQAIEVAHQTAGIDVLSNLNRFSTTIAAAKIGEAAIELVQNADSLAVVRYKDGRVDIPLGYHDQDLEIMKHWRQLADAGNTNIRELILDELHALRTKANKTFGVLNGAPEALQWLKTTSLDATAISEILLLTDGLFIPKSNPEDPENWSEIMGICIAHGLEGLLEIVRRKENEDPTLTTYPRYKQHDDATGIFIKLN